MISFLSRTVCLSNQFHHKFHQFFLIKLSFVDVFEKKKNPIIFTAAYLLYLILEMKSPRYHTKESKKIQSHKKVSNIKKIGRLF